VLWQQQQHSSRVRADLDERMDINLQCRAWQIELERHVDLRVQDTERANHLAAHRDIGTARREEGRVCLRVERARMSTYM